MKIHSDDRRVAYLEVFKSVLTQGDLTVTWVHPGAILGWHRHQDQDDHMLVLKGTLKVGMWRGELRRADASFCLQPWWAVSDLQWATLSDHDPKELVIPRGLWHGYQNIGTEEALVLTWITQPYNPNDEERLSPDAVDISWERVAR